MKPSKLTPRDLDYPAYWRLHPDRAPREILNVAPRTEWQKQREQRLGALGVVIALFALSAGVMLCLSAAYLSGVLQ